MSKDINNAYNLRSENYTYIKEKEDIQRQELFEIS